MTEAATTEEFDNDPFEAPATGAFFDWDSHKGNLLLIMVDEYVDHIPTVHTKPGEKSPAIRADIHVLDGEDAGAAYEGTLIFAKVMIPQLKKREGKMVLARLSQGEKKKGQNAPWNLDDATQTPEDKALGLAWLKQHTKDPFAG